MYEVKPNEEMVSEFKDLADRITNLSETFEGIEPTSLTQEDYDNYQKDFYHVKSMIQKLEVKALLKVYKGRLKDE